MACFYFGFIKINWSLILALNISIKESDIQHVVLRFLDSIRGGGGEGELSTSGNLAIIYTAGVWKGSLHTDNPLCSTWDHCVTSYPTGGTLEVSFSPSRNHQLQSESNLHSHIQRLLLCVDGVSTRQGDELFAYGNNRELSFELRCAIKCQEK